MVLVAKDMEFFAVDVSIGKLHIFEEILHIDIKVFNEYNICKFIIKKKV